MPWLQIKLQIAPDTASFYEDVLLETGCAAVTLQDTQDTPIFEPDLGTTPLWSNTTIMGLFDSDYDLDTTIEAIKSAHHAQYSDKPVPVISSEILEDKDWEREWMKNYHPMQFGQRLWICPSWREAPEPNAVNLMLDPGLAFGTGTHPTTALCLEWLDAQALDNLNVTDYGCGSGILGIAALLLGAKHVLAVDIDPQAIQATKDNLDRNRLSHETLHAYLPENAPHEESDLLVANILAGPLVALAPALAERVKPGGLIALSGLLNHQADEIVATYSQWFDLDPVTEREEWIRVTGRKK
jgi:ribosomal protein L11 methyltransferase